MKTMPLERLVHARAPIRVNDLGGWTDTWFAGRGRVLNLAVTPAVEVQILSLPNRPRRKARVVLRAENYGETVVLDPGRPRPEPHGLLQFAVAALPPGGEEALEISIHSGVPAGISTGTSAAVCVALLAALDALRPRTLGRARLAALAHRIETEKLGRQSGIQDQIAAAHGGISFIDMKSYPAARVTAVRVARPVWNELDRRLVLVDLGSPHRSSAVHDEVIASLEGGLGMERLEDLSRTAAQGRAALSAGDLEAYGAAMIRNHELQRALHPGLVSRVADEVAGLARGFDASGWKVNGAGGEGGSMTLLAPAADARRRELIRSLEGLGSGVRTIPIVLSRTGLEAWTVARGSRAKEIAVVLSNRANMISGGLK